MILRLKTTMMPPPLRSGDTIGIFSPSAPISATVPVRYERGRDYLMKMGFRVKEGSLTGKRDHYRSGSIRERADELNALIRDPEVRCIMSTIGGFNSNSLLPYIDYDALKADPKIIVGYSDVTAILLAIYAKTGLITFYGPACAASLGEFPPVVDETWRYFRDVTQPAVDLPHIFPTPEGWTDEMVDWKSQKGPKVLRPNALTTVRSGRVTGRLIGGNLNTMEGFFGTEYMPELGEGTVLYIEDSLKNASQIERSFSLLKLSGVLDRVSGIVLGKHELFDDMGTGRRPWEILLEVLGERDIPILADYDSCHTHPMVTLPIGAKVTLDSDEKTLTLESW